ncbi:DUF2970 domain-containing protein [Chitinimonas arctica]|uniref:DUF2970 domain-containing protein n=1 Tax=Chitinimonas arctica TaxID=2594795 RepID=A0A516SH45_9NEIS|nr:DUF2970 domain-containing protein [Chitinimonas arctica]QDQ27483.1 DUF2970 domain-containing protein [Chitinimonas arctica]
MGEQEKGSLNPLRAVGTVLSAFIGIRRGKDSKEALTRLRPVQIILAALLCAGLLIFGLLTLVRSITSH